jgi:hypothetical protein
MINKDNLPSEELRGMKLYHYTSVESFCKIWLSEHLRLCKYKNVNDIFEKQKIAAIEIPPKAGIPHHIPIGEKRLEPLAFVFHIISQFKQISFCKDYDDGTLGCLSSMMWGQYAKNENGVCIEFDKEKLLKNKSGLFCDDIRYSKDIEFITFPAFVFKDNPADSVRDAIVKEKRKIFFTKHEHWFFENEYRVVSDIKTQLTIKGAVNCVYVLSSDSLNTKLIKSVVHGRVPIKCIQVDFDICNTHLRIQNI